MTNTIKELAKAISGKPLKAAGKILEAYTGLDWQLHISPVDKKTGYTKKCAYSDKNLEIFVITWTPHGESQVHDHPEKGCIMRVMQGTIIETTFKCRKNKSDFVPVKRQTLGVGQIGYLEGKSLLHNIKNTGTVAYSIHIYSPPGFKTTYYKSCDEFSKSSS